MERLGATARLVRIRHTAQIVGIVIAVSLKSDTNLNSLTSRVASILLLAIALFLLDDAHDYKSDMVVHPERAIPKGTMKPGTVCLAGLALLSSGVIFASFLPMSQLLIFLSITALGLIVIFVTLESTVRSMLTALMIWALFPFSYASMNLKILLFGLLVGLPHIGGSIAKDFIHSQGDEKIGLAPPSGRSRYVAGSSFFLCSLVVLIPMLLDLVTWIYSLFIFPTFLCSLLLGIMILRNQYEKVYVYGMIGMVATLMAFVFDFN